MDVCYLCGNDFNENSTVDHGEHVIQQAIGGNLVSKGHPLQKMWWRAQP